MTTTTLNRRLFKADDPSHSNFDRIVVTPEAKYRFRRGSTMPDTWVLYRRDVPALTDEEWNQIPTGYYEADHYYDADQEAK